MNKLIAVVVTAAIAVFAAAAVGFGAYAYQMRDAVTVNAVVTSDDPVGFKAGNKGGVRFGKMVAFPNVDATAFKTVGYPGISDPVGSVVTVSVDKWTGDPLPPRDAIMTALLFAAIAGLLGGGAGHAYANTIIRGRNNSANPSDSTISATG